MNSTTARWFLGALVVLVQVAVPPSAALRAQNNLAACATADQRLDFEQATRDFREHRFAAAYGRFARLADAGHVPSACIALLMVRDGSALFRRDWFATPDQLRRWSAMTIEASRQPLQLDGSDA
jgi:hypothetical protein